MKAKRNTEGCDRSSAYTFRPVRVTAIESLESRTLLSLVHLGPVWRPHMTKPIGSYKLPAGWSAKPAFSVNPNVSPAGSTTPYGLTPSQMRGAYGLGPFGSSSVTFNGAQADGSGQTICIVDAYDDPNALGDLNAFSTYFGLPTFNSGGPTFTKYGVVNGSGLTATLPPAESPGGSTWEGEESLDIEWSHVMAPNANIVLVEASDTGIGLYDGDYYGSALTGVVAVSNSWSGGEFSGETGYDYFWTTPAGHVGGGGLTGGDTFLFSTGDSGAYSQGTTTISPAYPAASPNVVAVGGTRLTVGGGNTYGGESAWGSGTSSGSGGGGGGISSYESQPSYQNGFATPFSSTQRCYPDVSLEADPGAPGVALYDSYDNGASTPWLYGYEGGTSLSCPMMAGLVAVADQGRNSIGQGSLDGVSQTLPTIYRIAAATSYSTNFHDVTSGSNGYSAGTGYDLATGLGSVIGNPFLVSLSGALTTINGTSGNDTIRLVRSGNADLVYINNPSTAFYNVLRSTLPALTVASSSGIDVVNVDFSAGTTPVPATGLTVNGNGTGTTLILTGSTGNDTATVSGTAVVFNGSSINYSQISSIVVNGNGGIDSLTQTAQPSNGSTLIFNGGTSGGPSSNDSLNVSGGTFSFAAPASGTGINPISLASLTIGSSASVLVGTAVSHTDRWYLLLGALTLAGATGAWTGKLDLGENDMIIHNGNLATLSNQTAGGYAGGNWNGSGIASAVAAADTTHRTAIGTFLNASGRYGAGHLFDGYAPTTTDVLFKYTYYGDANLDGKIDTSDYSSVDNGFLTNQTGWQNGDFNYDGHVNGTDYTLADDLFNVQGNPL